MHAISCFRSVRMFMLWGAYQHLPENINRQSKMKISNPRITDTGRESRYTVQVEWKRGLGQLWFCVSPQYRDLLSGASDAAVAGLLLPAMAHGENIHVAGVLSAKLWHNLSGPYQMLMRKIIPWLRPISIHAENFCGIKRIPSPTGVATGFSGGVDSYCTLVDYHIADIPEGVKLTHLLFHNTGSHGHGEKGEKLFRNRYERLKPVAERFGLPFVQIDSNLDAFYDDVLGFELTNSIRNAAAALTLQGEIARYLYSSSDTYENLFVGPMENMAYCDPVTMPLLSTEQLEICSVGSEYTRAEKLLKIVDIPETRSCLDVCTRGDHAGNCSRCWKCLPTMLRLEMIGVLEKYSEVFDLNVYRRNRDKYLGEIIVGKGDIAKDIRSHAKSMNFRFPLNAYWLIAGNPKAIKQLPPINAIRNYLKKRALLKKVNRLHPV